MYIFLLIVSIPVIVGSIVIHGPWFKINETEKKHIRENGLLHFTTIECADSIVSNNFLQGKISDMGGIEKILGNMVWTYQYNNDIEKYHNFLVGKKRAVENKNMYKVCLKLTGFNEADLDKLYKRIGFNGDKAIVYRGEKLKPNNIKFVKRW